jgi:hypothetical protein
MRVNAKKSLSKIPHHFAYKVVGEKFINKFQFADEEGGVRKHEHPCVRSGGVHECVFRDDRSGAPALFEGRWRDCRKTVK